MRSKNGIIVFLVLMIVLSATIIQKTKSHASPVIFIDPSSLIDLTKTAGTNFTIKINVTDPDDPDGYVYGIHGWELKLRYNPVLLYTNSSLIKEGPFLKSGGSTFFWISIGFDYLQVSCLITSQNWADGSGTLVNITFTVKAGGETLLDLYDTKLLDVNGNIIEHSSRDGYFRNVNEGITPRASFFNSPTFPLWYENVTFDASSSLDPDGTVTRYLWFFGDNDLTTQKENTANETDPVAYHQYIKTVLEPEKSFVVRLTVIDNTGVTGNMSIQVLTVVSFREENDLAIVYVSVKSNYVEPGGSLPITVYVENQGNSSAIFNATVYYDSTPIATQTDIHLNASGTQPPLDLNFTWNPPTDILKGVYTLRAYVWPLTNETDTSDNTYTYGNVAVTYDPLVSFTYEPASPHVDEVIVFNASASIDPDGTIKNYAWLFDESLFNVTDASIVHSFSEGGTHYVALTVTDDLKVANTTTCYIDVLKLPSEITLAVSSTATAGLKSTLSGTISPVRSKVSVTILYRLGEGEWRVLDYSVTDQNGFYSCEWTPQTIGIYQFKSSWNGDQKYYGDESGVMAVEVKYGSSISLFVNPNSLTIGENVTVYGWVSPVREGASVAILYREAQGSWNILGNTLTNQSGDFTYNWKPTSVASYEIKASWEGDEVTYGAESDVKLLTVREAEPEPQPEPFNYLLLLGVVTLFVVGALMFWRFWAMRKRSSKN